MPTFGFFIITGLILGLISIRTLIYTIRNRQQLFNKHFTPSDRQRLTEASFFLLLPISVLLHEVGHAVAVIAFGGDVVSFGFFFFSGFVGFRGITAPDALFWTALAGNLVSVGLGLLAIAIPFIRPMRAPINFVLFAFGGISLFSSLIFYPLLDFGAGMHGDWSQIYTSDTPILSTVTGLIHVAILAAGVVAWRSTPARLAYARLTDLSPDAVRRVSQKQAAAELREAGERAARNWPHTVRVISDDQSNGQNAASTGITLHWTSEGYARVVGVYAIFEGNRRVEIHGAMQPLYTGPAPFQKAIQRVPGIPAPDKLEPLLRQALEQVERWQVTDGPQAQRSPSAAPDKKGENV